MSHKQYQNNLTGHEKETVQTHTREESKGRVMSNTECSVGDLYDKQIRLHTVQGVRREGLSLARVYYFSKEQKKNKKIKKKKERKTNKD